MTALNRRAVLATGAAALLTPRRAFAAFPERPVTVIVPYAAGGAGDVIIRLLSERRKSWVSRWSSTHAVAAVA